MKIWLDLRLTDNPGLFSDFIIELTKEIIKKDDNINFNIYCNNDNLTKEIIPKQNLKINNINIKNWSLEEQTKYYWILKKDNNDLMIFFDHNKPFFYKKSFVSFIYSLENIYYQNFDNMFEKYKYIFLLKNTLKKAEKIVCFENNNIEEVTEKFNINNKKIKIIKWFFPWENLIEENELIKIDVKTKFNIKNDFFIYSSWTWIHKNIDRLLSVIKRLKDSWKKLDLVFLWNDISKQIYIRETIINYKLQNEVFFLWEIKEEEKRNLYSKCIWVILPSFYEPFPFSLRDSIKYNSNIIASNIKNIKNIFQESISYFSPISTSSLEKTVLDCIENKKNKKINYNNVIETYNKKETAKDFLNIIM